MGGSCGNRWPDLQLQPARSGDAAEPDRKTRSGDTEFSPSLLIALETRFCGVYLGMADGAAAERTARQVIRTITTLNGPESPALFQAQIFLQEALYLEHKYKEALAQGDQNYARFSPVLGPQNQLTLAALTTRGMTKSAMQDYADAIRDQLAASNIARSLPSGAFAAESNLSDVATMECRSGRFQSGMAHARQVMEESNKRQSALPVFLNTATLALAECLISQRENEQGNAQAVELAQADHLLKSVDIATIAQTPGLAEVEGNIDVAQARLALLGSQYDLAKYYADKARPFLAKQDADDYERKAVARVNAALASHRQAPAHGSLLLGRVPPAD